MKMSLEMAILREHEMKEKNVKLMTQSFTASNSSSRKGFALT
jgi:hypothetical protein